MSVVIWILFQYGNILFMFLTLIYTEQMLWFHNPQWFLDQVIIDILEYITVNYFSSSFSCRLFAVIYSEFHCHMLFHHLSFSGHEDSSFRWIWSNLYLKKPNSIRFINMKDRKEGFSLEIQSNDWNGRVNFLSHFFVFKFSNFKRT